MKSKNKILFGMIIAAGIMLTAGFAFAQTPLPSTNPVPATGAAPSIDSSTGTNANDSTTIIIPKADLVKAQTDQSYCTGAFKNEVFNVTQQQFKTIFHAETDLTYAGESLNVNPQTVGLAQGCYIVDSNFGDNEDPALRSLNAQHIQSAIINSSKGISQADYQQALSDAAQEKNEASLWSKIVGFVIGGIFKIITFVVLVIMGLAGKVLAWALSASTYIGVPASVDQGWRFVRDLFNMFFVLAMIVMALGTILRLEKYNYKKLIFPLILMALLINFSETICVTLMHASDSLAMALAKNIDLGWSLDTIRKILTPNDSFWGLLYSGGIEAEAIRGLSGFILALVMTMAYAAIAALLIIRFVGLYVLIVVSPAAFALFALPNTRKYFNMWLDYFVKYIIWLPAVVLFMRLGQMFFDNNASANIFGDPYPDFTLLIISAFYWMAFYITRKSGLIGATAITSYAENGTKMLGKYVARGSMFRQAGQLADKAGFTNPKSKYFSGEKIGGLWQKGAQRLEAIRPAIKEGLDRTEANYQKGVKQAKRSYLNMAGLLDTSKEGVAELSYDEAYDKAVELFGPNGKGTAADLKKWANNLNDDGFKGLIMAGLQGKFKDPTGVDRWQGNIETLLRKRENIGDNVAGKVYNPGIDPATGAGMTFDPDKKTIEYNYKQPIPGGTPDPRKRQLNAGSDTAAFDAAEMSKLESDLSAKMEKLQRTREFYKGVENDTDADRKILEAQSSGRIFSQGEMQQAVSLLDATRGIGQRADITNSRIAANGAKIFLSRSAAEKLNLGIGQDANIPEGEIDQLISSVKGEITDEQEKMIRDVAKVMGSVNVFRGVMEPLKSYLNSGSLQAVREVRKSDSERKQHEATHMFMSYLEKFKPQAYTNIVNKVTSDPSFGSLKDQIVKENKIYSSYNDKQMVEEILARQSTYDRVKSSTEPLLNPERAGFRNQVRTILDKNKLSEKATQVQQRVVERVGVLCGTNSGASVAVNQAAAQIRNSAEELSKAASSVKDLSKNLGNVSEGLKEATTWQVTQTGITNEKLRGAAEQITSSAKTGERKLGEAAAVQEMSSQASADALKGAASALKSRAEVKPSAPVPPVAKPSANGANLDDLIKRQQK